MPRSRRSSRMFTATLIAATLSVVLSSTALAVDYGPGQTLRTAPDDGDLFVGGVAGAHHTISSLIEVDVVAVVWEEFGPEGVRSFIRESDDAGETFDPRRALRGGREAFGPEVAACDAGIFAVSTWPTAFGRTKVGLDQRQVTLRWESVLSPPVGLRGLPAPVSGWPWPTSICRRTHRT